MKILLVYPPFCTPASPPYSLTYMGSFLKENCKHEIRCIDLNLEFHKMKFPDLQKYFKNGIWADYEEKASEYRRLTVRCYSESNKKVLEGKNPDLFDEMLKKIEDEKPDMIAFSIVYSSQAFYAYSIIQRLQSIGKKCIVGGPAVSERLARTSDMFMEDETELLRYVGANGEKVDEPDHLDFSIWDLDEYFIPVPVIPIKTSTTCPYKACTFCTHYSSKKYEEISLDMIKKTIKASGQKYFFLIDDMITKKRLLDIGDALKDLGIFWTCQLRPTKDLDSETLRKLRESGLIMIMWGVESGCQRILDLMRKGTNKNDIEKVLKDSHEAEIKNILYIIYGFPSETKEELKETIDFLQDNKDSIDLISISVFGLQKNTEAYNNPDRYGIIEIHEEERTILNPKITYDVSEGLSQKQAARIKDRNKRKIENVNKYPDSMNFFREHMLCEIAPKRA